jgi:hypothetical protein
MYNWLCTLDIPVDREIAELEKKLGWRRERASPARCLECGSDAIVPLCAEGETVHPGEDRCQADLLEARYSTDGVRIAE